ncbi:hypothetical protein D9M68_808080 [compost metagenome]
MKTDERPKNVDHYIAAFPDSTQRQLTEVRTAILQAAPEALETIKYAMPTYVLHGNLVHFAAYKNHIGFYPAPKAIIAFADKLNGYKTSKGAIQFPLSQAMPIDLIRQITIYRVQQNREKALKNK